MFAYFISANYSKKDISNISIIAIAREELLMNKCPYCKKTAVYFIDKFKYIFNDDGLVCVECGGKLSLYIGGMIYSRILLFVFLLITVLGYLLLKELVFMPLPIIIGVFTVLTIHYFMPLRVDEKRI
jgi:hypothetical protein